MKKRILIADDNLDIVDIIKDYLENQGFSVTTAFDGSSALDIFEDGEFDLVLLDVMMPIYDGFYVCKEIRKNSDVPIIMITAKSQDADKIMGLEIGADDYIVKPFNSKEVVARVKSMLRRVSMDKNEIGKIEKIKGLLVDMDSKEVYIEDIKLELTKKEFDLMWLLSSNPNKVFTRENLLDSIWGYDYIGDARTVDTHMTRLRAKLEKQNKHGWDIKTVWGVGYKLEVNND